MSWSLYANKCAWLMVRKIQRYRNICKNTRNTKCLYKFNKQNDLNVYVLLSLKPCAAIYFLTNHCVHGCSAGEQLFHTGALTITIGTKMTWRTKTVIRLLVTAHWQLHSAHWHTWCHFASWSCESQTALWLISDLDFITEQILIFIFFN